jgi:hypothetical protein
LILSVSRRTDIPAFYTEWLFNRLKDEYVLVRNPYNFRQVSKVFLSPEVVDCIVFWTKDPSKMLDKLNLLGDYKYYFLITLNPYDNRIEKNVPPKGQVINSFIKLSKSIGANRTIWCYDPILLTDEIDLDYHRKRFEEIASLLEGYTERCVISFLDIYQKTQRNASGITAPDDKQTQELAKILSEIASPRGIKIQTCCEKIDLSALGIEHGSCIDKNLIEEITGEKLDIPKDKNQRDNCGCAASIDIGAYDSCRHGCIYCYANAGQNAVDINIKKHNPNSPLLIGDIEPEDIIIEKEAKSYKVNQLSFL